MSNERSNRHKHSEKEGFKDILMERRRILLGDANSIEEETLNKSRDHSRSELSSAPFHMADVGTENYDREFAMGILENEKEELREIDQALDRLEAGTYGICEACGKAIPPARLNALPYARVCVECKRDQENGRL